MGASRRKVEMAVKAWRMMGSRSDLPGGAAARPMGTGHVMTDYPGGVPDRLLRPIMILGWWPLIADTIAAGCQR